MTPELRKLWEGRLPGATHPAVEAYTSSLAVDRRLWREDIEGSRAHAEMLLSIGVLDADQHAAIQSGLDGVAAELAEGRFDFLDADEDIHSAIERRLHEIAGEPAGRLHSGRSRNDQVATDLRLYARRAGGELLLAVAGLQEALVRRASRHRDTPLPGYTHGQRAQVVSLAHHLLAYVEMLQRDAERLQDALVRVEVLPLGSGALAGSTLPLDREMVARRLGFAAISANSMDAVADRDFAVEIASGCALLMVHLSRLSEDLVLWMSVEHGFAELPDSHATGSSLMPQKKNPDVLELARGRAGRCIGAVVALLSLLKGLPLTYDRDLQEDKPALFDALDTAAATVAVLTETIDVISFDEARMAAAAADPDLVATDIAEYLVARGVPFRRAHGLVAGAVRTARERGHTIADLSLGEWRALCGDLDDDFVEIFDPAALLRRRDLAGGPGPGSVAAQLRRARRLIRSTRRSAAARAGTVLSR